MQTKQLRGIEETYSIQFTCLTFWLVYTPRWVILTFGPRRGIEHTPSSSFRLSTCDTCCLNTQLHHSAVGVCSMEIWTRLGGYIEGRRVEVKKTFVTCLSSCSGHIDLLLPHHTFISSISILISKQECIKRTQEYSKVKDLFTRRQRANKVSGYKAA